MLGVFLLVSIGAFILYGAFKASISDPFAAKVDQMVKAIIHAEGSNLPGSANIDHQLHNPGDLEQGDIGLGVYQGITRFANDTDGINALRDQVSRILTGNSQNYPAGSTLAEVGDRYSGGDSNWATIVAGDLGVSEDTDMSAWATSQQGSE